MWTAHCLCNSAIVFDAFINSLFSTRAAGSLVGRKWATLTLTLRKAGLSEWTRRHRCVSDNSVRAQGSRVHCCSGGLRRPLQVTVDPVGRDPGSSVSLGSGDTYRLFHLTTTNALTVFSSSSVTSPEEDHSLKHVIQLNKKRLESRWPLLSGKNAIKL